MSLMSMAAPWWREATTDKFHLELVHLHKIIQGLKEKYVLLQIRKQVEVKIPKTSPGLGLSPPEKAGSAQPHKDLIDETWRDGD